MLDKLLMGWYDGYTNKATHTALSRKEKNMKGERTDKLRRRPKGVRYFFLAVSRTTIHTGVSYGGLHYANTKHGVETLYVADLLTEKVIQVTEPIADFMTRWRAHYNDPDWDYAKDIEYDMPVPRID